MNRYYEDQTMYIQYSSKSVRKFGRDLGYGITMGVFSAAVVIGATVNVAKAIKKFATKKFTEEDLKKTKQKTAAEEAEEIEEFLK